MGLLSCCCQYKCTWGLLCCWKYSTLGVYCVVVVSISVHGVYYCCCQYKCTWGLLLFSFYGILWFPSHFRILTKFLDVQGCHRHFSIKNTDMVFKLILFFQTTKVKLTQIFQIIDQKDHIFSRQNVKQLFKKGFFSLFNPALSRKA